MNAKIEVAVPTDLDKLRFRVRCPDSLDLGTIAKIREILKTSASRIDNLVRKSGGVASWTYQTYEASVFWFIVLYRPLQFQHEHGLLRNGLVVREMLNEAGAAALRMSNQGIVIDPDKKWMILAWNEAMENGVLHGIRQIPLWRRILMQQLRCGEGGVDRLSEKKHSQIARRIATATTFLVPHWTLHRTGFFREKLFWLSDQERADMVAFDLSGVDAVLGDVAEINASREQVSKLAAPNGEQADPALKALLGARWKGAWMPKSEEEAALIEGLRPFPTPRATSYAHLYTTAKNEYQEARQEYQKIQRRRLSQQPEEVARIKAAGERAKLKKAFAMDTHITPHAGRDISRVIQDLAKVFGFARKSRWLAFLSREESLRMLELCCKRCLWSFASSRSPELIDLMGSSLEGDNIVETTHVGWSEERAKRIQSIALNLESLAEAWALPLEYSVWTTSKNLDGKRETVVAWAHETLQMTLKLQTEWASTRKRLLKKEKEQKKKRGRKKKGRRF